MGPPLPVDKKTGFAIAQMPAIILYLGETLDLLPATAALRAITFEIVNDANDVVDEIIQDGGREMWTKKKWAGATTRGGLGLVRKLIKQMDGTVHLHSDNGTHWTLAFPMTDGAPSIAA
jgi:hypothetical protein